MSDTVDEKMTGEIDVENLDFNKLISNPKFKEVVDNYAKTQAEAQIKAIHENKNKILSESKNKDAMILELQSKLKKSGGKKDDGETLTQSQFEEKMSEFRSSWEAERLAEKKQLEDLARAERERADSMYKTTKLESALTKFRVNKEDRELVTPYLLRNVEIVRNENGDIVENIRGIDESKMFGKDGKKIDITGLVEHFRNENPKYFSPDPISGGGTGPGSSDYKSKISINDLDSMSSKQLAEALRNGAKL